MDPDQTGVLVQPGNISRLAVDAEIAGNKSRFEIASHDAHVRCVLCSISRPARFLSNGEEASMRPHIDCAAPSRGGRYLDFAGGLRILIGASSFFAGGVQLPSICVGTRADFPDSRASHAPGAPHYTDLEQAFWSLRKAKKKRSHIGHCRIRATSVPSRTPRNSLKGSIHRVQTTPWDASIPSLREVEGFS